eukprot:233031_1
MTEETSPLTARLLNEEQEKEAAREEFLPNHKDDTEEITVTAETPWEKGEKQPPKFRDWPYGILFYIQFIAVITLGSITVKKFVNYNNDALDDDTAIDFYSLSDFLVPFFITAGTAILLIIFAFVVMARMGESFITCSVWTSAIVSFVIGVTALSGGLFLLGLMSLISALIGCCYACAVKDRIPFAAANLAAGISSIKSNAGITLISFLFGGIMLGWMMLWIISLFWVVDISQVNCDANGDDCEIEMKHPGWVVLWMFFLFWTQQVFKNIIHTTIAGVVGTWYYDPQDAKSFCSPAIGTSVYRSLTFSFGSICLGSLLAAILQTLDWIVNSLRQQQQQDQNAGLGSVVLLCCLDCILSLLQGLMEFFNKWAFIYVGVYGYTYVTAGKKVMKLFKERGWTVIINDNLVNNALGLMCIAISLLSGIAPVLLRTTSAEKFFGIGFIIALLLSMTVMNVISSAVSTIIVCFAEAPGELERNHEIHSINMKEAWSKVYDIVF